MKVYPFHVMPRLPVQLEPLRDLAQNLWFSWNWQAAKLLARVSPELWQETNQNPVQMLGRMPQERLEELAADDSFVAALHRVYDDYQTYRNQTKWFHKFDTTREEAMVAYFSCEYGIAEGLPIYSGGLGVLSGDHLKSASDLGIPLVAVGLLYQLGYFRQYLNNDGWQQETYPENDWYGMPVQIARDENQKAIMLTVTMRGQVVHARVWRAQVGLTPLYLLDTNLPENAPPHRAITHRLYGGDRETRIQQELLLGVGGVRALRALGIQPKVYHMNEGHSAFLALERLRVLMREKGLSYAEAFEHAWATNVFTTHTPVPAGNERFSTELLHPYLHPLAEDLGLRWNDFMALGRVDPNDDKEPFCMTVLALKLSARCNGVARLHGKVSRKMWHDLWPDLPRREVPITSITNGIHTPTWTSHELSDLLLAYLGPKMIEQPWDMQVWDRVDDIPDIELWRTHQRSRERLVFFARKRLREQVTRHGVGREALEFADSVLDPRALTIGFARRFAAYKRGHLLFSDPERLHKILGNTDRPVQVIFAGKAHPQDSQGKEIIKRIVHYAREDRFRSHVVFLENYDMNLARYLVQGVDVWLNTPRRPLEASGTSGMKAAANGALNLSVLDGWWDEAYGPDTLSTGWSIGGGEQYEDLDYQDNVESQSLYDVLESEVIPMFYNRDRSGLPREWIRCSKSAMRQLTRYFNTHRMLIEYTEQAYLPAAEAHRRLEADDFRKTKELASWRAHLMDGWGQVAIASVDIGDGRNRLVSGEKLIVNIAAHLGGLGPDDVSVEVYYGPLNGQEEILEGRIQAATFQGEQDGLHRFQAAVDAGACGRLGFAARVVPRNADLVHPFMTNTVVWERR